VALSPGARTVALPGHVHAAWSDASRGDLRPTGGHAAGAAALSRFASDMAATTGAPVHLVATAGQVHGAGVLDVDLGGPDDTPPEGGGPVVRCLAEGDALVSRDRATALCVLTADCGALALASPEGVFAAVHAGWRGLLAGVVEAAVGRMREQGATDVVGALGPCIHAGCYEFSPSDLDAVAEVYGGSVRGRTAGGRPALDVPAGISAALERAGASGVEGVDACTACAEGYFSHRARRDTGRQALLVWSGPASGRA
jgi:copper oxidase (laccase) domain-containing protein